MVYVATSIEIAASPEQVREVFFDWAAFPQWSTSNIKSIKALGDKKPINVVPGDKIKIGFDGIKMTAEVGENTPQKFEWKGGWRGILTASHTFRFESSKENAGGTTFYNNEEFHGLIGDLSKSTSQGGGGFQSFNNNFKARVEKLQQHKGDVAAAAA